MEIPVRNVVTESLSSRGFYHHSSPYAPLLDSIDACSPLPIMQFFSSGTETKYLACSKDRARRGYSPSDSENFATLVGEKRGNDSVEKFRVGPEIAADVKDMNAEYFSSKASRVHFFCNDWSQVDKDFRLSALLIYRIAEQIMLSIIHEINPDIASFFNLNTSILSLNYYSENNRNSDVTTATRIAGHKDVSFFTIVSNLTPNQCNNTKLQVFDDISHEWIDVHIENGSFVILVGEYLEYVSAGVYKAVLHRVVNANSLDVEDSNIRNRLSFAFFVSPNYDAKIDLRPNDCCTQEIMTYDEWRKWKIAEAMKVKRK